MPGCNVEATFEANPAGVIAFVLFVPAITSAFDARITPPVEVVVAGASEMRPPTELIPFPITTAPNCVLDAGSRLRETLGPGPPPERPGPTVILLMVPVPGGKADSVPSGDIIKFAPHLIPPSEALVAGTRLMVPVVVIVPPVRPTPAVIDEIVPPALDALTMTPEGVTVSPDPRIRGPDPESILYEGAE
jgi:hypothetical protein